MNIKKRAKRNKTVTLSKRELNYYSKDLIYLTKKAKSSEILNKTINQDLFETIKHLPNGFVDLLFIDPPYNLSKSFNTISFKKKSVDEYSDWIDSFLSGLVRVLKPTASIYFCGDWHSSTSIYRIISKYFIVRNRITWEREKGRGANNNWKNSSEDIWFCTFSDNYFFNSDAVKLKRRVIAPYKDKSGNPKDWQHDDEGNGFRLTYPSNLWNDISIPFWSMSENTDHPTQKPEKLLAKLILASSKENDIVFDPFLGSGTTSVTAKKLKRNFVGIECDKEYACLTEKRLQLADSNNTIQGYQDGVFWERNSSKIKNKIKGHK